MEGYVRELNSLEARRGRKPLDVNNVIYWFKNTRAAVKRTEMKTRALQGGRGTDRFACRPIDVRELSFLGECKRDQNYA